MSNSRIICGELKSVSEAVVAYFEALSLHLPGETKENYETAVSTADLRAKISNRDLPNVK